MIPSRSEVRGGRLRLIASTAVVTSLAWIVGLALWMQGREPPATVVIPLAAPVATTAPAQPAPPAASALLIPVAGVIAAQLVDTFTQSRANGGRTHDAIDIMAPRGTPVIAAAAGRVEKLFLSKVGGNTVYVRSPDGRLIY